MLDEQRLSHRELREVIDATRAVPRARKLLVRRQIELWPEALRAINGAYPQEIAERPHRF